MFLVGVDHSGRIGQVIAEIMESL